MAQSLGSPAEVYKTVTPHDSNRVFTDAKFQWIYVGGTAGNVVVNPGGGQSNVTIPAAANSYHPVQGTVILSTGTTATPIIAAKL